MFGSVMPVEAGIMDSISGFFSKASSTVKGWFSGGGTKEFEALLTKVQESQVTVADKQSAIIGKATTGGQSNIDPSSAGYQTKMNELAEASRTNEELYKQLLQVRQELVDKKRDVTKYKESFDNISQTQRNLEEGYQAIQNASREKGAFAPVSDVVAAGGTDGPPWADPKVQKFMDEWLLANGLDEFGRLLGGIVVAVADPDMDGKTREQWLWEAMFDNKGRLTKSTLESYVNKRLKGAAAAPPSAIEVAANNNTGGSQVENSSSSTKSSASGVPSTVEIPAGASLNDVESQLKTAMKSYEEMAENSEGDSDEAKQLLSNIKVLKTQRDTMIQQKTGAQSQ